MKEKGKSHIKALDQEQEQLEKKIWWDELIPKDIIDSLPNMSKCPSAKLRIQVPVHDSTDLIATKIREKYPAKFRINLDVYKSMLYAGRQLFDFVYLGHLADVQKSKSYKMAKVMEELDTTNYTESFVEEILGKLMEGYLSSGQGRFTRDKIGEKIDELRLLVPEYLHERLDIFLDEEIDAVVLQARVKGRVKKRDYRNRKKNIRLVEG